MHGVMHAYFIINHTKCSLHFTIILEPQPIIAFTASGSTYASEDLDPGDRFTFDVVHLNVGGWYDGQHDFTCGASGYYLISFGLMAREHSPAYARIHINGRSRPGPFHMSDGRNINSRQSASNTFFVYCAKDEVAYVMAHSSSTSRVIDGSFNYFSGMLIRAT